MNKRLLFSVAVVSVNHVPLMKLTTPNIQNGLHGPNPLIIVLSSDCYYVVVSTVLAVHGLLLHCMTSMMTLFSMFFVCGNVM